MIEWILVIGMDLNSDIADERNLTINAIDGFTTEEKCKKAGQDLSSSILHLGLTSKGDSGLKTSKTTLKQTCIPVEK